MKKLSGGEKISLIITLIFVFTTLTVNIKNFKKDIKYITSTEINKEYNTKQNRDKEEKYSVKDHISNLWDTLGEAIEYLKTNINNKEKVQEIEKIIDNSIIALNSIENALNKNYKYTSSNLRLYIKEMKTGFINLREILEKDNESKEKILKCIEQNYIKGKREQN